MRQRPAVIAAVLGAIAVVLAGGTLIVGRMLANSGPECTVPRPAGSADTAPLDLDAVQLQHASTINAVGLARGLPERAQVIALATAWQESSLRNLDHGDRDSLGLFQQRHSQGWGTQDEVQDPVYASGAFYDALVKVQGWESMPLTEAAQAVQRSGHPDAYAKWEADAEALAVELDGGAPPRLSCRSGAVASTRPAPDRAPVPGSERLDARLVKTLAAAQAELGAVTIVTSTDSTSVTVTIPLPEPSESQAGRALAAWSVAHATSFGLDAVAVDDSIWAGHRWGPSGDVLTPGEVTLAVTG